MKDKQLYTERLSSNRTEALFLGLVLLFFWLAQRRKRQDGTGRNILKAVFRSLSVFFLFYALNYRRLTIRLTPDCLELRFGIFTWRVPMANIEDAILDETSLWRIGGAGIHFSPIKGRYRAMFNFLEHPRVVIALKQKQGPVRDIAFSTRQPHQVLQFIQEAVSQKGEDHVWPRQS